MDLPPGLRTAQRIIEARRESAGERPSSAGSSKGGNSGVLVEEEKSTWLKDWTEGRQKHLAEWLGTTGVMGSGSRRVSSEDERRPSREDVVRGNEGGSEEAMSEDLHARDGVQGKDTH